MPKLRNIRKNPKLDMNPMVDMAFLLVSFFMMTTTFKADLPEDVVIPPSTSELKLPENELCTITLGASGSVYFAIDNKFHRRHLLQMMGDKYGLTFSETHQDAFSLTPAFGVPMAEMPAFLDARLSQTAFEQPGIPVGDHGELRDWLLSARMANPKLRFAINADGRVKYPIVQEVFETLRDLNITRFNLVTDIKVSDAASN